MMKRMTCILCPNGCKLKVEYSGKEILSVEGGKCPRGDKFADQELNDPQRNIATSVLVKGGALPLASVRLTAPIPKDRIFDVVETIKALICTAPLQAGDVLIQDILGLGADVICTKDVDRIQS